MSATDMQGLTQAVVSRARSQGFVRPREIRQELAQAGIPDACWKEVVTLARPQLSFRQGRYHYVSPLAARLREAQRTKRGVQRAVRQVVRAHRKAIAQQVERRQHARFHVIRPVTVLTADRRELRLLSCDISDSGIRLIGTHRLQGQKVRLTISADEAGGPPWHFIVQILWTSEVGDNMFENGGVFVEAEGRRQ
jgi:PilZ domain-containing protein